MDKQAQLTGMSAGVTLEVKGVIETLATKGTEISLHIRVTFQVSVQKSGQSKPFSTHVALEWVVGTWAGASGRLTGSARTNRTAHSICIATQKGVLDSMASIYKLDGVQ